MTNIKWTQELFDKTAEEIIDQFGCIPPQRFLDAKGYSRFRHAIRQFSPTMAELRKRFNVQDVRITSVDQQIWKSFAEVNIANMLIIRGFAVTQGRLYPKQYSEQYPRDHAIYDLHFVATCEPYRGIEINCEVWGGPKGGAGKDQEAVDHYAETKSFKLDFHKNMDNFLGIDFMDCYKDARILEALHPYIGDVAVLPEYVAKLPPVAVVALPVYETVIEKCKDILVKLDSKELPPVPWFRRTETYKNRTIYDWEPASWSSFVTQLNMVKISVVRQALGEKCRAQWTKEKVFEEIVEWYHHHDVPPAQIAWRAEQLDAPTDTDRALHQQAKSLANAACKYFNAGELKDLVKQSLAANPPIEPVESTRQRKQWSAETVIDALVDWNQKHNIDPLAMMNKLKQIISPSEAQLQLMSEACCLDHALRRYFGKVGDPKRDAMMQTLTSRLGRRPAFTEQKERKWTADRVVAVMAEWSKKYNMTPGKMRTQLSKKQSPSEEDLALKSHASGLEHAIHRYFGKNKTSFEELVRRKVDELDQNA